MAGAIFPIAAGVASFLGERRRARRAERAFEQGLGEAGARLEQIATSQLPGIQAARQQAQASFLQRSREAAAREAAARARAGVSELSPFAEAQRRARLEQEIAARANLLAGLGQTEATLSAAAQQALANLAAQRGTQLAEFALRRPGLEDLLSVALPPIARFGSGEEGPRTLRTFLGFPRRRPFVTGGDVMASRAPLVTTVFGGAS